MSSETSENVHYCKICRKKYQSQEMMEQHLNTKKHKKNAQQKGRRGSFSTDDGASSIKKDSETQSDKNNPFDEEFVDKSLTENSKIEEPRKTAMDSLRICLFCNQPSTGVKKNLDHMRKEHSFYILDIDCLISLKALLHYLAEKINIGHCCIKCNRSFQDALAVQNHMKDLCHCCMNSDAFDDEYEYFYDFAPTYEENFVGKKLEDFDLTEEPLAKPLKEQIFSRVEEENNKEEDNKDAEMVMVAEPMEDIKEAAHDNDEDWEDIDVEDDDEDELDIHASSATGSFQKISTPSTSSFTMIDKTDSNTSHPEPKQTEEEKREEIKSLADQSNISEAEVAKLLERRKKNRFDYQRVTDNYKKAIVLDTGEVKLPGGKIIGHRQWVREYNQKLNFKDVKEQQVIKKLGIEYKKMGADNNGTIQKSFNPQKMFKKYNGHKMLNENKKSDLKLKVKENKITTRNLYQARLQ